MALSKSELNRLAEAGARVRVQELRAEIDSIYRNFPGLRRSGGAAPVASTAAASARKLRGWTAAQKKEVSDRMRRYWASKRAQKKKR